MKRWILYPICTFLLALSLSLTLAFSIATVAPINFGPYPNTYRDRSVSTFCIASHNHMLEVYFLTHPITPRSPVRVWGGYHDAGEDMEIHPMFSYHGFYYERYEYIDNSSNLVTIRGHDLTIPCWMLVVVFLPVTVLLGLPRLRRCLRRKSLADPSHACPDCGYDLRAHKPGNRCPECGTMITSEATP